MLRRILITVLATSAISIAILGWVSCVLPVYREYRITSRFYVYIYSSGGLARLYGIRASEDVFLDPIRGAARMEVRRVADNALCGGWYHAAADRIAPFDCIWDRWHPQELRPLIAVHFFGLRSWTWLPVLLLIAYPVVALLLERIHHYLRRYRQKRGLCPKCGYNLTGLPEPRCPECGTKIEHL